MLDNLWEGATVVGALSTGKDLLLLLIESLFIIIALCLLWYLFNHQKYER